ncbi:MAG: arginine repressor [Clostridiaceae bacterium]
MKTKRQAKILELISRKEIETQEDLAEELNKTGIEVTQATVSRDIKELKLIKILTETGKYKYATNISTSSLSNNKLVNIFNEIVIHIDNVDNFVVIKTITGSANAAAEAIDSLKLNGIVGTIAGDNTIFILARDKETAINIITRLKKILNG